MMSREVCRFGFALALMFSLCACGGGGPTGSDQDNLAIGSSGVAIDSYNNGVTALNGMIFFLASETSQNATDMNGDQDAADNVVMSVDPDTGTTVNTGVSAEAAPTAVGNRLVWSVLESEQGAQDLNGDGDFGDRVLVIYDPAQPVSPTNPEITNQTLAAGTFFETYLDFVVFAASEADARQDYNSDGDMIDSVVFTRNLNNSAITNTQLAFALSQPALFVDAGLVGFAVSEVESGPMGTDLNMDGDASDVVGYVTQLSTGITRPLGPGFPRASASRITVGGTEAQPYVLYTISESGEGDVNFNAGFGDTDTGDDVIAVFDFNASSETLPLGGIAVSPAQIVASATRAAFVASEPDNGTSQDFNSDTDSDDEVPFWIDLTNAATTYSVGVAVTDDASNLQVCDNYMTFLVNEANEGTGASLNSLSGDTDSDDEIVFWLDITAPGGNLINTGMVGSSVICFQGENCFFTISAENEQGETDLNADGDTDDVVPVYFRVEPTTGTLVRGETSVGMDGFIAFQICPSFIRIYGNAFEGNIYGDINEDGDTEDYGLIASRLDRRDGAVLSFRALTGTDATGDIVPFIVDADTVVFATQEGVFSPNGLNINAASGDTDTDDIVLMFVNSLCY